MESVLYEFDSLPLCRLQSYVFQRVTDRRLTPIYHAHDFYECLFITEGSLTNVINKHKETMDLGDLMIITDHINLLPNPLIGPNMAEFGPRFPDMHDCYSSAVRAKATAIAERENIKLQYGVYVGTTGPTFETQAEYRYFKAIGGDAVGMSTVPEVIVARHMGVPTFGVSVVTNCGLSDEKGDHEDVQLQGRKAGVRMAKLFVELIKELE